MGWLWGSKNDESEAVRNLDPGLRKFLDEGKPSERPAAPPRPDAPSNVEILKTSGSAASHPPLSDAPRAPRESLYPDGRYADLWKNYRPLHEIEQVGKTDQDRLTDLVDAITERKYQLKEAAIENCALEALAIQDCYKSANTWQMLSLCRTENRAYDRCFEMQGKFLKALGFMAQVGDNVGAERVQMHADKLYRQMLEQEARQKEAQEKGLPVPEYKPVMSKENVARAMGLGTEVDKDHLWSKVKPDIRKAFEERLEGKTGDERELEMRLIESEMEMAVDSMNTVRDIRRQEREERAARKREGRSTIADKAKGWWGWSEDDGT